ncbi:hypothetical protein E4U43_007890 [Claviceps pusilla]|uniref:Uncharacterized protein n=1 Tax=Claviceps pusilla TaxID=123648 RepID=A0A9P7T171_9HYPO|nr:hypothetical protein E4U43_007890 [Claviceps pusilla]
MAPSAWIRHPRAVEKAHILNCTRLWIVMGVVAGILVLTGLTTAVVVSIVKCRRRYRDHQSRRHSSPYLEVISKEWPHPSFPASRTYSDLSLRKSFDAKHEYQRLYMIQKSLASRAAASGEFAPADKSDKSRNDPIQKPTSSLRPPNHEKRDVGTACSDKKGPANQQSQRYKVPVGLAGEQKEREAQLQREGEKFMKSHPAIGTA